MGDLPPAEILARPGRRPWSRKRVALLLGALLVVGLIGLVVDHDLRGREERALDDCVEQAQQAVAQASGPVLAMASYVRPVLDNGPTPRLRRGLYALVSESAAGAEQRLADARRRCRGIDVLWVHPDLRTRQDACLRGLDDRAAYLHSVARHGRAAFRGGRLWSPGCTDAPGGP